MFSSIFKMWGWVASVAFILLVVYFFPWRQISWGSVSMAPGKVITVTGEARSQQSNEVAQYSAGVNAVNDTKETAVKEVNEAVAAIIESVKGFGIEEKDIKTSNMNIYQNQETYYDGGTQKYRLGQWNVSNTIEITLRDVTRAAELADLLSSSGANNVWGPNFSLEDSSDADGELMQEAMANAKEKAEVLAAASGAKLGKVVQVIEGGSGGQVSPLMFRDGMGGGGSPVEPGTTTVYKSVTVSFELK